MRTRIRASAALVLLALFPVFALAVAGGVILAGIALVKYSSTGGGKLALIGLFALISVIVGIVRARKARPESMPGTVITRAQQPGLWAEIDDLAARMSVEGPASLTIDGAVNAAVTEVTGQREMVIGLPLLGGLTRDELRSVLAHELGHYARGHTRLGAVTYRAGTRVGTVLNRIDSAVVALPLRGYAWLYAWLAAGANRDHELEADDWSARLAGPAAAASAMRRLDTIGDAWGSLLGAYLPLAGAARLRPPLVVGLRSLMEQPSASDHQTGEKRSVLDSHPPTSVRIARFEAMEAEARAVGQGSLARDTRPATSLLAGGDADLPAIECAITGDTDEPGTWAEIVERGIVADAKQLVALATESAASVTGSACVGVGELLDLFAEGAAAKIIDPLMAVGLPAERWAEARTVAVRECLDAAATVALAATGRGRHALSWSGPACRETRGPDGTWIRLDLEDDLDLVAREPVRARQLKERLEQLGGDLGAVVRPERAVSAEALAAAGHVALRTPAVRGGKRERGKKATVDVVVFDSGVLIARPAPLRKLAVSTERMQRDAVARCAALVDAAKADPAAFAAHSDVGDDGRPALRWIPRGDIVSGRARRSMGGKELEIGLASGERIVVRDGQHTVRLGQPAEALEALAFKPS